MRCGVFLIDVWIMFTGLYRIESDNQDTFRMSWQTCEFMSHKHRFVKGVRGKSEIGLWRYQDVLYSVCDCCMGMWYTAQAILFITKLATTWIISERDRLLLPRKQEFLFCKQLFKRQIGNTTKHLPHGKPEKSSPCTWSRTWKVMLNPDFKELIPNTFSRTNKKDFAI